MLLGLGAGTAGAAPQEGTPGYFEVKASSPECEVIELEYSSGIAPVTVDISGPASYTEILTRDDRVRTLTDVPPGTYTVGALPGKEYDPEEDSPVNVVGSQLVVDSCVTGVTVRAECNGNYLKLFAENPTNQDVWLVWRTVWPFGAVSSSGVTIPANSPETLLRSTLGGAGFTHTFTARVGATSDTWTWIDVNGVSSYTLPPYEEICA
ncbi:hypothetical protein [Haloferax sp. DFSO52]|uniref:hypothetical protein n=1 Tax=Haloferax sp. DFSO52 TaxID=3388505 RepID=UPI003A887C71